MFRYEQVVVGPFGVNCWIVVGAKHQAIVIDPGYDAEEIHWALVRLKAQVALYICTHGHVDHISALAAIQRRYPAPVAMHPEDERWAFTFTNSLEPDYPKPDRPAQIERMLQDGESFTDVGIQWTVIGTPGHTPGGICVHIPSEKVLFTGDTLFAGSVGRTDFPGGNSRVLTASLRKLVTLPNDTVVCPGHGPTTTIGEEKRTNFFIRAPDVEPETGRKRL